MTAIERWRSGLEALAIPHDILEAAPESPWGFHVGMFSDRAEQALQRRTPSQQRALEALPDGGSVLDVGCGAGAASLPLVPPAGLVMGVDESHDMLREFAGRVEERGAGHAEMPGRWPDVAGRVPPADVVVCHHVFFNVGDLDTFAARLTNHARRRVVVETSARHPLQWLQPLWRDLHGWAPPDAPTVADAVDVLADLGYDVGVERWSDDSLGARLEGDELVAFVRRRLCLPANRDPDVRAALDAHPPPQQRRLVTLWWDGQAA